MRDEVEGRVRSGRERLRALVGWARGQAGTCLATSRTRSPASSRCGEAGFAWGGSLNLLLRPFTASLSLASAARDAQVALQATAKRTLTRARQVAVAALCGDSLHRFSNELGLRASADTAVFQRRSCTLDSFSTYAPSSPIAPRCLRAQRRKSRALACCSSSVEKS